MTEPTASDEALLLDNQLCFLIYRLHRGMTDLYRPILTALGLTYPQYLVMLTLWEHSTLTVGQIGAKLHLDSGTLSPLLKRLEAAGFVRRERAQGDERSVEVSLTKQGRDLRRKARTVPRAVGGCLVGSAEQADAVRQQLLALVERVDAARCAPSTSV